MLTQSITQYDIRAIATSYDNLDNITKLQNDIVNLKNAIAFEHLTVDNQYLTSFVGCMFVCCMTSFVEESKMVPMEVL